MTSFGYPENRENPKIALRDTLQGYFYSLYLQHYLIFTKHSKIKMKRKHLLILYVLFSTISPFLAQNTPPAIEWQKCFGGTSEDFFSSAVETTDGGFISVGAAYSNDGDLTGISQYNFLDIWVVKTSKSKNIEWQKKLGGTSSERPNSVIQTADGGFLILGQTQSTDGDVVGLHGYLPDIWLVKLSPSGAIQWQKCLGGSGSEQPGAIKKTRDGGYIVVGTTSSSNDGDVTGSHLYDDGWLVKLSALGAIQWEKSFGGTSIDQLQDVHQTADDGYIVAGYATSFNGIFSTNHSIRNSSDAWVIKLSSTGVQEWQKLLGGYDNDKATTIIQSIDGGYLMAGIAHSLEGDVSGNHGNGDMWVVKMASNGTIQWQKAMGGGSRESATKVIEAADGGFLVVGDAESSDGDVQSVRGSEIWLIKFSAQGFVLWKKLLGGSSSETAPSIAPTSDGGYVISGKTNSNNGDVSGNHTLNGFPSDEGWLVKLAPQPKFVRGRVEKTNTFCQSFFPSQYAAFSTVKIEKNAATIYYVTTDSLGFFKTSVDTGRFQVSVVPFNNLWTACPPITIAFSEILSDTAVVNPSLYINSNCPLMESQLTTPFLRRCFESVYTINYANRGTAIQNDATAELTLDSMLNFVSATRPVRSRGGNKIIFSLGNVGINQSGQFDVKVLVSCNSQIGQTHCSSVLIPKTMSCDTVQDSIPTIVNQCVTGCDSISFLVTRPNSALNKTFKYQLIADATLLDTGRFSMTNAFNLKHKRDGRTYRFEVRNAVTNQLLAARSAETDPSVSSGFVNQFSQSIKQTNIAENCTMNRGSFDPNDKSAVPTGIGTRRFIEQGKDIEYLVQFQNTGTDTAFTVVVKDTLAPHFNLSTFKLNASSHVSTWQLNPKGVLIVTFNNINLVDSFTNEKNSHGFFKYAIKLNDSIVTNTIVANKAAIYFDFNDPIITNLTTHTIGKEALKNCLLKPKLTVNYSGCPSRNIAFNAVSKDAGLNPTFAWYRNAETGPLSINANFTLNNAVNGTKIYCKLIASDDICTDKPNVTSDTIVINCIGVGTNDLNLIVQNFDVFPNPNKGVFTVKLNTIKPEKIELNILNYLGQTIKSESINTTNYQKEFNLTDVPKGIYLIKLTINGQSLVKRMSVF
jgi:uncharacterized repeat protein (TIGR01451 family)